MEKDKTRKWPALLGLIAYSALLVYLTIRAAAEPHEKELSLLHLQSLREAYDWLIDRSLKALYNIGRFIPVGFLLPFIFPRVERWLPRVFFVAIPSLLLAIVLSGWLLGFALGYPWQMPGSLDMILPGLGCILGAWMGMSWLRGPRARLLILPKLAVFVILISTGFLALLHLSTEPEPLPFSTDDVTSSEKRELIRLFRRGGQPTPEGTDAKVFTLSKQNLDALLGWALSLGAGEKKARMELGEGTGNVQVSVGIPTGSEDRRYVNCITGIRGGVRNGELDLEVDALSLGQLDAPRWLLRFLSPVAKTTLRHDRRLKPVWDGIDELRVQPDNIAVRYTSIDVPRQALPYLLAGVNSNEEVLEATRAQMQHMAETAETLPRGEARVGACLESAFAVARDRSANGNPVAENRAALFALGILLGHPHLENFIGPVASDRVILGTRRALGEVTIRGRTDWTKHFFLSAGLAALSNENLSDAAGVLKEELDAEAGGSGFSFTDLLADRAGNHFARVATQSEVSAAALQKRLYEGFEIDVFFPEAADLPEGLSESELQSKYGGVGGPEYNRIVAEIERRVADCAAYR